MQFGISLVAVATCLWAVAGFVFAQEDVRKERSSAPISTAISDGILNRPVNRSSAPLGFKPHQASQFLGSSWQSGRSLRPTDLLQTVPYPSGIEDLFPGNANVKKFYVSCAELTKKVRRTIQGTGELSATEAKLYDEKCLGKLSSLIPERRAWIESRLVLLGWDQGGAFVSPHCTGLLLSPRHVVTAKHCFYDSEHSLMPWQQLRVYRISDPETPLTVSALPTTSDRTPLALVYANSGVAAVDDVAFATLAGPLGQVTSARVSIPNAPLAPGQRQLDVVVPGISGVVAKSSGIVLTPKDAVAHVRVDISGGCFAQRIDESSCYVHSCHTSEGTSGAPVLAFAGAGAALKVTLLAVHSGARGQASDCPAKVPAELNAAVPNLANFPKGSLFEDPTVIVQLD